MNGTNKVSQAEQTARLAHIERWYGMGIPMSMYAKQEGLVYSSFKSWCAKYRHKHPDKFTKDKTGKFIPIKVSSRTKAGSPVVLVSLVFNYGYCMVCLISVLGRC